MIQESQEGVAWPSYVDFLSTFTFVLIIFLGSLIYLMAQGIRQGQFQQDVTKSIPVLLNGGFQPAKGRLQLTVPFSGKLEFGKGCPGRNGCPTDLTKEEQNSLLTLANIIGEDHKRCTRIIVRGQADSDKYRDPITGQIDEFGNYELSNKRASMVLRYLLLGCEDCSTSFKAQRSKLTLAGVGDTLAPKTGPARDGDRTVNVVIDYSSNAQ
jgi:hypothetical protein